MIFLHHNLHSNFSSALAGGDTNLTTDIFVNEVSDIIVFETQKLVDALTTSKISASIKESDEELVEKVIDNLYSNKSLSKAMGFTIAESNKLINTDKGKKEDWKKIIDSIADSLVKISKDFDSPEIRDELKTTIMKQIEAKAKERKNYSRNIYRKGFFTKKRVLIGLGAVALIVGAVWLYKRHKSKQALMLAGGSMGAPMPPLPAPDIAPVVPPAPAPPVVAPPAPPVPVVPPVVTPTPTV